MLFSEPKIPQSRYRNYGAGASPVSVLFSEPKIPQSDVVHRRALCADVSVLFSEPKIPQCIRCAAHALNRARFSALQRAENSSMSQVRRGCRAIPPFQCSSASRKFLNRTARYGSVPQPRVFQCSSASRKFLNLASLIPLEKYFIIVSVLFSEPKIPQCELHERDRQRPARFSALQRAENSSIRIGAAVTRCACSVSVLFSEPKIPQWYGVYDTLYGASPFQCSSASRKFLNRGHHRRTGARARFQCSSASRKFLNIAQVAPGPPAGRRARSAPH